ncbi:MAG TPA: DUF433 domain-containing protein [Ktedonobacterales bacterium]|nr:DUF433 domain-containing protein [Ktedonobacterales bacterium]
MREIAPGIVSDPEILGGRPTVKGHRITVSQLMGQLAGGMTIREMQDDYNLRDEEVSALLAFAAQAVQEKEWQYAPRP